MVAKPRTVWTEVPSAHLLIYALSVALALFVGNFMRPLGGSPANFDVGGSGGVLVSAAAARSAPKDSRLQECKMRGDIFAAKLGSPGHYENEFNLSFVSPVSAGLDPTFLRLAIPTHTDKVTRHSFHYLYSKHLSHVRYLDLNIMEIGLGCSMKIGTGNSLKLWRAYLPCAKISFLEHMRECAEEWRDVVEKEGEGKLYIGSQSDPVLLNEVVRDSKAFGGFDLLVDDGSHNPNYQFAALDYLWEAVKPGGIYVIEDFYKYFDKPIEMTVLPSPTQPLPLIQSLLIMMNCQSVLGKYYAEENKVWCREQAANNKFRNVVSIDCMAETCALVKGKSLTGWD